MIESTSLTSQITNMISQPATSSDKEIMGRDDFLLVLITQLRHQDPMEPMAQEEMIAQLTQFNILDEIRNVNTALAQGMEQNQNSVALLVALQEALLNSQTVSLIGREIRAVHPELAVGEGEGDPPTYCFEVPAGAANVTVTILDQNGTPVRVEDLGARNGSVEYRPNTDGLSRGAYLIQAEAVMSDGSSQVLSPHLRGTVNGVRFVEGATVLEVDGQQVYLSEIISVAA